MAPPVREERREVGLCFSLITATFNSAATVEDTLRSVDSQTYGNFEHLLIDGVSRDATLKIISENAADRRVVVSEPDQGIYDAMNKGLALATGDIVGLLNSDDFLAAPDVLATIAAAFVDPNIDAVYGDLCYVRQDVSAQIVRYWRSSPFRPGAFARGWAPPHPTLYVRREIYDRLGHFDLAYALTADLELMVRFLEVHRIRTRYIPKVFVHMRLGGATNKSLRNIVSGNREIWRALHKHGLAGSLLGFVVGKLLSRGRQFITRPSRP